MRVVRAVFLLILQLYSIRSFSSTYVARSPVVAVIDTGIDPKVVRDKLWINPLEIRDGIDNDLNGLIDDINGWDFTRNENPKEDHDGHGTHVADLILQTSAQNVRIMPLAYFDRKAKSQQKTLEWSVQALKYAVDHHADIINYSGGGESSNADELRELRRAEALGILVVAAAGNSGQRISADKSGSYSFYPASYRLKNVVVVAAKATTGRLIPESNFGDWVDFAALGLDVVARGPGGRPLKLSGTSQATALVSGLASATYNLNQEVMDSGRAEKIIAELFLISNLQRELIRDSNLPVLDETSITKYQKELEVRRKGVELLSALRKSKLRR